MQIGQGESLVHFLCPALPNRPHQTVVVVKSGQDGLSQTLYLQKWPKSAFEIVVSIYRPKGGFLQNFVYMHNPAHLQSTYLQRYAHETRRFLLPAHEKMGGGGRFLPPNRRK